MLREGRPHVPAQRDHLERGERRQHRGREHHVDGTHDGRPRDLVSVLRGEILDLRVAQPGQAAQPRALPGRRSASRAAVVRAHVPHPVIAARRGREAEADRASEDEAAAEVDEADAERRRGRHVWRRRRERAKVRLHRREAAGHHQRAEDHPVSGLSVLEHLAHGGRPGVAEDGQHDLGALRRWRVKAQLVEPGRTQPRTKATGQLVRVASDGDGGDADAHAQIERQPRRRGRARLGNMCRHCRG